MKLLLDQGLPRGAVAEFRRLGFDAVHAGDVGMQVAADEDIVEYGRREGRTIITLDADFYTILALSNAASPSIIRVRVEGLRAKPLAALVARAISLCQTDLGTGAMVAVDEHSVRVRTLPLVR